MNAKKIVLILLLSFFYQLLPAQKTTVNSLQELAASNTAEEIVVVKDQANGGIFFRVSGDVKVDNGVVFRRKKGGFWVRQFNRATGVNPCWWGAAGDGINDDLPALNAATAYCLENETILQFPSGVFRITGSWIIGGKTIDEQDLFSGKLTKDSSFSMRQHEIARKYNPLIIRGSTKTCVYGDFTSNKLTAIIYYNIKGNGVAGKPTAHLYTHEFSNIGIYGSGFFKGTTATPPAYENLRNQQIGLVMLNCNNPTIDRCNFSGLQYGLLFKTSYWGNIKNCYFELCQTGIYGTDYNANLIENVMGAYCKLLAKINGSQLVLNNFNSEFCETTLVFTGKNIVLNGVYCENNLLKLPNNYQLIFGRNEADPGYSSRSVTTGVVINGLTLTAAGRDVILLEDDMKQLSITAGTINGNIVTKNAANKIVLTNTNGGFKVTGPAMIQKTDQQD